MPSHTCPVCGREFQYESVAASKDYPFCSHRCKLIDLGKWLEGEYVVPGSVEEDGTNEEEKDE